MAPANLRRHPKSAAAEWFHIREVGDAIYAIEEPGHVQSYLVNGRLRSALIDTGLGLAPLKPALMDLAHTDMLVLKALEKKPVHRYHLFDRCGGIAIIALVDSQHFVRDHCPVIQSQACDRL